MALTDATRLANFSSGVGTDGTLDTNNINATGIVTASSFEGDGSQLTGVSGFATALSSDQTSILNRFFKTPEEIPIGAGTSAVSYTHLRAHET